MNITTENIILKNYCELDFIDYYRLKSNELVWKYSTFIPFKSLDEAKIHFAELLRVQKETEYVFNALYLKNTLKYIGEAGILSHNSKSDRCTIGYNLLPEYWHKGYATEIVRAIVKYALDEIHIERIEALVYTENIASRKVLENAGFKLEGVLRNFSKKNEEYKDVCYYGGIRCDFSGT
jgi:ribosomal-protein-alanine N-acetyltransferase